jgi:hypothetical protein
MYQDHGRHQSIGVKKKIFKTGIPTRIPKSFDRLQVKWRDLQLEIQFLSSCCNTVL